MNRILPALLLLLCSSSAVSAQPNDSLKSTHDSIRWILPIPEIGSIEPFGDTATNISENGIIFREYRSLYDILSREPGIFVRDLASAGQQNQLSIYGIDGKNIAILVDGIPFNDHYTGTYNLWLIPPDAVERIELQTGAGALFYDGKSGGGAINIVTKNFANNRAVTRLRYSQGISGYTHTDAMFAQNVMEGLNLSFALAHYGFGSNKSNQNYRARFQNSNTDSWMLRSKLRYNLTSTLNLSFTYTYDRTWTGLHGGVDYDNTASLFDGLAATVSNTESFDKLFNSHYHLTAAYFPFEDSAMSATFSLYAFERLREYRDEENRGSIPNGIFVNRDLSSAGRGMKFQLFTRIAGIRFLGYTDMKRVQSKDIITVGAKSELFRGSFFSLSAFAAAKDYQDQFTAHGGAEGTISIGPSLQLFGGITQNLLHDKPTGTVNDPSMMNYAERLRETFTVLEAGGRFTGDVLSAGVTVRRTTEYDPVIFDTIPPASVSSGSSYYFPGSFTYDAASVFLHFQWSDFHAEGNITYIVQPSRTRMAGLQSSVTLFPEYMTNGSVYYHGLLADGALELKIGVRGNLVSEQTGMRPYDEFGVWIPSSELTYGPGGTIDFFAIGKIGDAYVHLIWENLTGNNYLLAPVYPMYDRNVRFGLSWEFLD